MQWNKCCKKWNHRNITKWKRIKIKVQSHEKGDNSPKNLYEIYYVCESV